MGVNNCPKPAGMLAVVFTLAVLVQSAYGRIHHHRFVVKSSSYTRLCSTKKILTVNGKFPGPTLTASRGDRLIIQFHNKAKYNITLHWHGVRQPRNPWSDGAEYVNQCPIRPGEKFTYNVQLTTEEGTMWWHAHSGWARATVHGMIIVYPKPGTSYPFPKPYAEVPIILGEWWKKNVMDIPGNANKTGGEPILSDAYTINGQPGDLYPCSKQETFRMNVKHGERYLLRIVSAVMDENVFFSVAQHKLTLVGTDGFYTQPFQTDYIMITPGQSMDVLLEADQQSSHLYYMAARAYSSAFGAGFDKTTTTGILQYGRASDHSSSPIFPRLPPYNSTQASTEFSRRLRSLASREHPIDVPLKVDTHLFFTVSVNLIDCRGNSCKGPFGKRFSASLNNVSFVQPSVDILQAYYHHIRGVFEGNFPRNPPVKFDYTGKNLPDNLLTPDFGTRALVLEYNASVELILQGTNVLASDNHPIHLHGYGFYVVGWGFGNFDPEKDPLGYNLVDPPQETTVGIPNNGWVAIRFRADNPGVWFMHCHLERHQSWGMSTIIVVRNGDTAQTRLLPPPHDLPSC
ncbi:laccase-14 [Sesamum indicum]|uniref:Laccase n=1 Tax=Sesamum indicum TaxID=4182 RepID=A0A6I9U1Y2_SESIN|nr:laccase-14 [Sesamum indicum]